MRETPLGTRDQGHIVMFPALWDFRYFDRDLTMYENQGAVVELNYYPLADAVEPHVETWPSACAPMREKRLRPMHSLPMAHTNKRSTLTTESLVYFLALVFMCSNKRDERAMSASILVNGDRSSCGKMD